MELVIIRLYLKCKIGLKIVGARLSNGSIIRLKPIEIYEHYLMESLNKPSVYVETKVAKLATLVTAE